MLRILRDTISSTIFNAVDARDLPALSRELRAVLAEIASLDTASPEVSAGDRIVAELADELAPRRRVVTQTGT